MPTDPRWRSAEVQQHQGRGGVIQQLGAQLKEFPLDQGPEILIAIAFGIGGRDLAAQTLGDWRQRLEKKQ